MVIVNNYGLAIFFYVICCICWGSWANTQKMVTTKSWRFELFYWDLTWGLFLTALIAALTLGSFGSVGRTFFQDLAQANLSSVGYAVLGGIVWNAGNILFSAAIAIAGMSVGFPIGGGIGWIGGIIFNYMLIILSGQVYSGNQTLLFVGVACIVVAIIFCAIAYNKLSSGQGGKSPAKGIILAIIAGIGFMFFYGLVVKSLDPEFVAGGTGNLTPFSGVFFFATGILISTPIFNSIAMRNPVDGEKVTFKDYLKGDSRTHMIGLLGGLIWMTGMVVSFMSAGVANPAISYALSNASPIVAMIWGIFIWKEFKGAPKGTNGLLVTMFLLFLLGLVVITMSNA
jgi:glucose uptake protein